MFYISKPWPISRPVPVIFLSLCRNLKGGFGDYVEPKYVDDDLLFFGLTLDMAKIVEARRLRAIEEESND